MIFVEISKRIVQISFCCTKRKTNHRSDYAFKHNSPYRVICTIFSYIRNDVSRFDFHMKKTMLSLILRWVHFRLKVEQQ